MAILRHKSTQAERECKRIQLQMEAECKRIMLTDTIQNLVRNAVAGDNHAHHLANGDVLVNGSGVESLRPQVEAPQTKLELKEGGIAVPIQSPSATSSSSSNVPSFVQKYSDQVNTSTRKKGNKRHSPLDGDLRGSLSSSSGNGSALGSRRGYLLNGDYGDSSAGSALITTPQSMRMRTAADPLPEQPISTNHQIPINPMLNPHHHLPYTGTLNPLNRSTASMNTPNYLVDHPSSSIHHHQTLSSASSRHHRTYERPKFEIYYGYEQDPSSRDYKFDPSMGHYEEINSSHYEAI